MKRLKRLTVLGVVAGIVVMLFASASGWVADEALTPRIRGEWWQIAGDPDLGRLSRPEQQPVDFAVWQAADGSWQLWSCIRRIGPEGKNRVFFRWQGAKLTDTNWKPMGIAMEADPGFGEDGYRGDYVGLQAPHVVKVKGVYYMFYGDMEHLCLATSTDGKTFARQLGADGKSGLFSEGTDGHARDPMILPVGDRYHCYYTASPGRPETENKGAVYCRTSRDLRTWSEAKIVASGGIAGTSGSSAECPFVVHHSASGCYYLFRTQRYGQDALTTLYRSKNPFDFGVNDDRFRIGTLPVAAPEIVEDGGEYYIASLLQNLKGVRMARLAWVPAS